MGSFKPQSTQLQNPCKANDKNGKKCPICQQHADKVCSSCKSVYYCSVEHQKQDWKKHRKDCQIFIIQSNEQYGRYMIAARDISPGTMIMNEPVIIYGPRQGTDPVCLGCHKLLIPTRLYLCSKCKIPLCGPSCEKIPIHADNECKVFSEHKVPTPRSANFEDPSPIYECILTLRCLMLKKSHPKKWEQLTAMTCQNENRKETLPELWARNQENTVQFLLKKCGFDKEFTELDVNSALGYADINSFEIKVQGRDDVCGLFNNTYLMSHDCVSNTHHTFSSDIRMVVRAAVPIKKGQQITTGYASILDGTAQRSAELYESKFFTCNCARCMDPTELKTNFTGIKCHQQLCSGDENACFIPMNPLIPFSMWTCNICSSTMSSAKVELITQTIKNEIAGTEVAMQFQPQTVIPQLEQLLKKYQGKVLHANHYLVVQMLHSLVSLYGRVKDWTINELNFNQLKRMEEICLHLLRVLNVLEPGMSRLRGFTLYQLHAARFFIAQKEFQVKTINKVQLEEKLTNVLELLKESYQILSFDGINTPEGMIATTIPSSIKDVQNMLAQLVKSS